MSLELHSTLSHTPTKPRATTDYQTIDPELDQEAVLASKQPGCSRLGLGLVALTTFLLAVVVGFMLGQGEEAASLDGGAAHAKNIGNVAGQVLQEVTIKIPSFAQKAELQALCTQWYHCEVGPPLVEPNGVVVTGPGCIEERATHMERWAFHDAGTYSVVADNGGAHACNVHPGTQRTCSNNIGLQVEPDSLKAVYDTHVVDPVTGVAMCSLADFLHFCAVEGVRLSSLNAVVAGTGVEIDMTPDFRFGRTDCFDQGDAVSNVCGYAERLPPSSLDWNGVVTSMGGMGFTEKEIVDIMGSHTMGGLGAHTNHLLGDWTLNAGTFDNFYYKSVTQRNWVRRVTQDEPLGPGVGVQWAGSFFTDESTMTVTPHQGPCPPFAPTDNAGNPLVPAGPLAPGCFIDPAKTAPVCNPCAELNALRTDLELSYDTVTDGTCSLLETDIQAGVAACPRNRPQADYAAMLAMDPVMFANAYKLAHLKMSEFGNKHITASSELPQEFTGMVDFYPSVPIPDPVPVPAQPRAGKGRRVRV